MAIPALIIDDDPVSYELMVFLLKEGGFSVEVLEEGRHAVETIRKKRPAVILLDILMPGIDGLTLLHRIKTDPELQDIMVVMVTGKAFPAERERAQQYGADGFIQKPYNVDTFAKKIWGVLGAPGGLKEEPTAAEAPAAAPKSFEPAADAKLHVSVWGCRSLSTETNPPPSRYGFKTSCVSVETPDHLLVFDAGTGLEDLGTEIIKAGNHKTIHIFVSHFHQDHVQGLGSFACARLKGYKLIIYGAVEPDKSVEDRVSEAFEKWPGSGAPIAADIEIRELEEKFQEILPGVKLWPFKTNHPPYTLGFVLEAEGSKLVYCPDSEVFGEEAAQEYDARLGGTCAGADLMIHDGRYTEAAYEDCKHSGHSFFLNVLELAANSGVARLLFFHHDDQAKDEVLDGMLEEAERHGASRGYAVQPAMAFQGQKIAV